MEKVFYHIVRLFRKFWFLLLMALAISPLFLLMVLVVAMFISMTMFDDYEEEKDPADYFTEEELRKLQSDGDDMDDEEFLRLVVKYDMYQCPAKIDPVTTWNSSQLTKDAYICCYEINDRWHRYNTDLSTVKEKVLSTLDRNSRKVQSLMATNRSLILRYWNRQTDAVEDVVFTTDELKG